MHPHITAGILERALHTTVGTEACLAARGNVPLQNALTEQARRALAEHGADPRHPTDHQLLTCAQALRDSCEPPTADPHAIAAALLAAADWLGTRSYGPARAKLGDDIIDSVVRTAPGDLRAQFDVLTVITQHLPVPGLTITGWEWTANPGGGVRAVELLRDLAARRVVPSYIPLPTEPAPGHHRIDLTSPALDDLARRAAAAQAGRPAPEPADADERRTLTRAHQEAAARAGHPDLAGLYQDRADTLRTRRPS